MKITLFIAGLLFAIGIVIASVAYAGYIPKNFISTGFFLCSLSLVKVGILLGTNACLNTRSMQRNRSYTTQFTDLEKHVGKVTQPPEKLLETDSIPFHRHDLSHNTWTCVGNRPNENTIVRLMGFGENGVEVIKEIVTDKHYKKAESIAHDENTLYVVDGSNICCWDLKTGNQLETWMNVDEGYSIYKISLTQDRIVTSSLRESFNVCHKIWNKNTRELIGFSNKKIATPFAVVEDTFYSARDVKSQGLHIMKATDQGQIICQYLKDDNKDNRIEIWDPKTKESETILKCKESVHRMCLDDNLLVVQLTDEFSLNPERSRVCVYDLIQKKWVSHFDLGSNRVVIGTLEGSVIVKELPSGDKFHIFYI